LSAALGRTVARKSSIGDLHVRAGGLELDNYIINSIWLSEQQVAQMCNFGRKHQRYLVAMQYKIREDYLGYTHSTFFYNNHFTKYVYQVEV